MYKIISSLLLIAFFASTSTFANTGKPVSTVSKQDAPENMISVTLTQTAAGTATGTWSATSPGPFLVTLTNLNTGQRIANFQTFNTSAVFTNLATKTTYRLTVGDVDLMFDDEQITF